MATTRRTVERSAFIMIEEWVLTTFAAIYWPVSQVVLNAMNECIVNGLDDLVVVRIYMY